MIRVKKTKNKRSFYVVQFVEFPYEGIDDYVCVPYTWLIVRRASDQKAVVAYPKNEDPFVTRDRVERKEIHDDDWKFYVAFVKHESDSFKDANLWIDTRNNYGPIVEEDSGVKDMESMFPVDRKLRSSNRSLNSSKSKKGKLERKVDNPRKPLPKTSIKQPAISKWMIQFHERRAKLDKAAQSSMTAVYYSYVDPGCSKNNQSIKMKDNQPMANAQTKETASASYDEQNTEQNNQTQSFPLKVDNSEDNTIDGEDYSQGVEQPYQSNSTTQSHLFCNTMAPTMTAPTLLSTTEQKSQPQLADVRSVAADYDDHEQRTNDIFNNGTSSSYYLTNSLLMSAHLYRHMEGARRLVPIGQTVTKQIRPMNIDKKLTTAAQKPPILMNQNESLSTYSVEEQSTVRTQNQSQDVSQVLEMQMRNNINQAAPLRNISREIQHVPGINIRRSHEVSDVDPTVVLQSFSNIASTSKNFSSSSQQRSSFVPRLDSNLPGQEQYLQQTTRLQGIAQRPSEFETTNQKTCSLAENSFTESNNQDYRPNIQTIRMRSPQKKPQRPKIRIGITITPKSNSQHSILKGVTKKTPPLIVSRVLDSIRKTLSATQENHLPNEQELQASLRVKSNELNSTGLATSPVNIAASATCEIDNEIPTCSFYQSPKTQDTENRHHNLRMQKQLVDQSTESSLRMKQEMESPPKVMDNSRQTDESMIENSPYHGVTFVYDTDREISNHDMRTDEIPAETSNEYSTGIDTGNSSEDRPTSAQNSTPTSHQTNSRVVMEQQMLDNFATLFTQMGSTLRYTCDMYNNLRKSILDSAETYKKLLNAVERFNTASNVSTSSNVTPEIQQAAEERPVEGKSTEKKQNNLWRFDLPPKYDCHDSRWTLKHRENMPGLVELMPQSGIYVSYGELKYCQKKSKDCKSLARRLLREVFNMDALSVCSSITEKAQVSSNIDCNERPGLDEHANKTLLNFVIKHGLQCGWNTDLQPILITLHRKIQELRFRYGVMVKC